MTVAMKMDDIRRRSLNEGREEERENSILALVQTVKELVPEQHLAVKKLMERYNLSFADAEEKVKLYW